MKLLFYMESDVQWQLVPFGAECPSGVLSSPH